MHVPSLIELKRDGRELSAAQIDFLIAGLTDGGIPEYQWSALAMAIYFQGMTDEETWNLTRAMRDSGATMQYGPNHPPIVDKHSTGGVGDKVSLLLAPLLACEGLWVPMISGRGLGITGGTLDKLESIPGFNTRLSETQFLAQLESIGVFMAGQTATLCPADKKLYSLRDVTATVPSQPLIVASIMSKKLAENLDRLVLDVKFGSGAFMKTRALAESLASALVATGKQAGVECHAILTPMNEPLGTAVGNALEVQECLETMRGSGPPDLIELTLNLAQKICPASREQLEETLVKGKALAKFEELAAAQGGDLAKFSHSCKAAVVLEIPAPASGTVMAADAEIIGRACVALGGGRSKTEDIINFAVGFDQLKKIGAPIRTGEPLCRVHAASQEDAERAREQVLKAYAIQ